MTMTVRVAKLFLGAAVGETLIGGSAAARPYCAEYRGTIQNGHDLLGTFGPPGADLAGSTFDAQCTFDLNAPDCTNHDGDLQARVEDVGLISGTLTINGRSEIWEAPGFGPAYLFSGFPMMPANGSAYPYDAMRAYLEDLTGRIVDQMNSFVGPSKIRRRQREVQ